MRFASFMKSEIGTSSARSVGSIPTLINSGSEAKPFKQFFIIFLFMENDLLITSKSTFWSKTRFSYLSLGNILITEEWTFGIGLKLSGVTSITFSTS